MNNLTVSLVACLSGDKECNRAYWNAFEQMPNSTCDKASKVASCFIDGSDIHTTRCDSSHINYSTVIGSNITLTRLSSQEGKRCHVSDCNLEEGIQRNPSATCKISGCNYASLFGQAICDYKKWTLWINIDIFDISNLF